MRQRTKELWVIPTIIALATGVPLGAAFMLLGLWLAGTPIHPSFSIEWVWRALSASLPVWVTVAVLSVAAIITGLLFRQRARTAEEAAEKHFAVQSLRNAEDRMAKLTEEHAAEIENLNSKEPRLHGVWNNAQTFWHMGKQGEAPRMQIGGWIDLTSSNTKETLYLLAAYIGDSRAQTFMGTEVKPGVVNRAMVMLFIVPPLATDTTRPFTATIVVEDQFNRRYQLPTHEFRATPARTPAPPPSLEGREPILHASWLGDSAWGWVSSHPEEDPIYVIRGDVTLLMDNIKEPVIITGVEIEGAESLGTFDNFKLDPGQPVTRGVRLHFRGKAPAGNDYYALQLVFKDLRGNRYPSHRFNPLPIPERVGVQRGAGNVL
jgi:hypothetical protein